MRVNKYFLFLLLILTGVAGVVRPNGSPDVDKPKVSPSQTDDSHLLEIGRAETLQPIPPSASQLKIISYNIRWRGGDELRRLSELFKNDPQIGGAALLGLQEVDRNRKRTRNQNTVKALATDLGMHYAWAAPPAPKATDEEETGVAILSRYPLAELNRIVLPHEGPGKRRRVGLGATVKVGTRNLRVYSVHSETRISVDKKLEQMKAVLADLARFPKDMPAVVLGDLNTWEWDAGTRTEKLFTGEGFHTPFDGKSTFCQQILFVPLKLRLDWVWLRNLQATSHGVDREIKVSDHWPLWINLQLDAPKSEAPKPER
jgi:endonuclease/exonuclease/phosphatase family metal-dependent hydrolase